jgi:tRNA dimethylallyltransferase
MGPTAAGKTELAITLTQHLPCDIISVDSAMVYRSLDIGTAKPSPTVLAQAPHRLIDIRDPSEIYSVAQFHTDALVEIKAIHATGHIPLLVGGTRLYFHALQQGLSTLPSANPQVRQRLQQEAAQLGWSVLHQRLAQIDATAAQRIHPHDAQRIQRALEVYEVSGYTLTAWYTKTIVQRWKDPIIKLIVAPAQRHILHDRIAQRFRSMLEAGFIGEVQRLFNRGDLNPDLPALRTVGYRQMWRYLAGELNYASMSEQAIIATRQLAKRQLTWLRAETDSLWFDSQQTDLTQQVLNYLVRKLTVGQP